LLIFGVTPHLLENNLMKKSMKTSLSIALGTTFIAAMSAAPVANADANPFGMQNLESGYMHVAEGKCGEGKKDKEAKCGEGKCGGEKAKEAKCGEGKCGEGMMNKSEKAKEAKCGEGKCGGEKK
jgi:uncharacterized low-complexity protein